MEDLIKSDIGLITRDNANWLFQQGVITRDGSIKNNSVDGMIEKKAQVYSYFRWVLQDIKEKIPTTPKQVTLEIDNIIDIMRTGSISISYKVGEDEFHYIARYPIVKSIYDIGRRVCLDHQSKKGKKKEFVDFED